MKLAPLTYHSPASVAEATDLLAEFGDDAKVIAGGQSLIPMLSYRLIHISHLVDIARIEELAGFGLDDGALRIRARATQRELERSLDVGIAFPILHEAIANIAHVQIRNRGTVCGSLAHADPTAELPTAMVALSASMVVRSAQGEREIPAEDFFVFHLTSALESTEILVETRIPPLAQRTFGSFAEVTHRKGDFALVGVAAVARFDADNRVEDCRVVCSGVGPTPLRADPAEALLRGNRLDDALVLDAQEAVRACVDAADDVHASAGYRRSVAGTLARRCLNHIRAQQGVEPRE